MLKKFSNIRSLSDNIKLGILTAFTAGMVNVASLVLFFSFTSNITGHYAILADEIANGRWFQVFVVLGWISLYFIGSFISNFMIIHIHEKHTYLAHALPLILEVVCLLCVGFYGQYFYQETLMETEFMVATLLLAMGLQNGLTASISNFALKTTHLTGLTTDLAINISMLTSKKMRSNKAIKEKILLLTSIAFAYVTGGIVAGSLTHFFQFSVFFYIATFLMVVILYDFSKIHLTFKFQSKGKIKIPS